MNTLNQKIEEKLTYIPKRIIDFKGGKAVKEYIISENEMKELLLSIAQDTVEAVRLAKKEIDPYEVEGAETTDDWRYIGQDEGFNQAISEQAKKANDYLNN